MDFNTQCDQFKTQLYNLVNSANIPIAVKYFVITNLYNDTEKAYYATLNQAALSSEGESHAIPFGDTGDSDSTTEA